MLSTRLSYMVVYKPGLPVATYAWALAHASLVRWGKLAVAYDGLTVVKNPSFAGPYAGRVCDGLGTVLTNGNEIGCVSVLWDVGDVTTWTRACDDFDVVTADDD